MQRIGAPKDAGYTTRKDGPGAAVRQRILKEVFWGQRDMPGWLSDTVSLQWGHPRQLSASTKLEALLMLVSEIKRVSQTHQRRQLRSGKET